MALVASSLVRNNVGNQVKITGKLAFDNSYPTNGEQLSAAALGLAYMEDFEIKSTEDKYSFECELDAGGSGVAITVKDSEFQGSAQKVSRSYSMTHDGTPGGNPVYIKADAAGHIYLACNMATTTADKLIQFVSGGSLRITHDAAAASGSAQVYFDEDGTPSQQRLRADLTSIVGANDAYLLVSDGSVVWVTHDATPTGEGVAFNYDDGADQRIEFVSPTTSNANLATHPNVAWAAGVPAGVSDLAEVDNGTDLSALTAVEFEAIGK